MGELNDEIFHAEREGATNPNASNLERSPDEILSNDELRQKIEAALAKLSPEHREAVLLKDVQGLSYKEIAEVMHSSLGTVMSRLFYARQKLQSLLQDEYEAR
jgi:RNA polymerase sigma-70 factor, ECF subfamily